MSRYDQNFKNSIVRKILLPDGPGIAAISEETGISLPTLYSWIRKLRQDVEMDAPNKNPNDRSIIEKYELLLEASAIAPENLGPFLRERGIHEEHLKLYRNDVRAVLKKNSIDMRHEISDVKKKNHELEKELKRKEKALAELSTLLVIKKKWIPILNPEEDV